MRPLKSSLRALGWTVAGIAALTGLVWLGSFLYWHLRLTSALRAWEKEIRAVPSGARDFSRYPNGPQVLYSAGCRALPYVVAALDRSDGHPRFQEALMHYIINALPDPGPNSEESSRVLGERSSRWEFIAEGLDLERRDKLADFRAWWRENGHKYHAWWRTWSSGCGGEDATPDGRR